MTNKYEIYDGEDGYVYVVVPHTLSKDDALGIANRHFRKKRETLHIFEAKSSGDMIHFDYKGKPDVWAISTR